MTPGLVSYLIEYSSEPEASGKRDKVIVFPKVLHVLDFDSNRTVRNYDDDADDDGDNNVVVVIMALIFKSSVYLI